MNHRSGDVRRVLGFRSHRSLAVAALCAAACGPNGSPGTGSSGDDTSVMEAITGGSTIATGDLPGSGVVRIATGKQLCSGTLLNNRWVLTANHCFCSSDVSSPGSTYVSVYGNDADSQNPSLQPLYQTTATQIIKNPNFDVALVRVAQTLPLTQGPTIYTGNGSDLPGQSVSQWGFGPTQNSLGRATGTVAQNFSGFGPGQIEACPSETAPTTNGPIVTPVHTENGDSGGGLFRPNNTLVGVLSGDISVSPDGGKTFPHYDGYTGIWLVRDWIRQATTFQVFPQSSCVTSLPIGTGGQPVKPALAEAADGTVHIAMAQSDGSIGHWQMDLAGVHALGNVPGVSTNANDAVGLGLESSGNPAKLGLAYRDRSSGLLSYVRMSANGTWSAPIMRGSTFLAAGPAMTRGGPIAFMMTNDRVYVTFFDPVAGDFGSALRPPTSAPLADPGRRISVAFEPAYGGVTWIGYRATNGDWMQSTGSQSCSTYFCDVNPRFSNSWNSAMLAYKTGDRLSIVTTSNDFVLDRVAFGTTNYPWTQQSNQFMDGEPGAAEIGNNLAWVGDFFIIGQLAYGIADDCFANSF